MCPSRRSPGTTSATLGPFRLSNPPKPEGHILYVEDEDAVRSLVARALGGYGYCEEYPIARAWADARVQRIYGGTTEIMWEVIARSMGLPGR